ncbi:UNVERIFIED_CONTAM: hypothetical protein Sradi_0860100 [Sesamum radiatum]|uniref:DUF659 domain-containing protein n=1 Tax=Sesamum radiatum TaxID=300843 RepID=A0AAW2V2J3_SESRA
MNSKNASQSHSGGDGDSTSQDSRPLWKFVTKSGRTEGGGNVSFTCNLCKVAYKGSYSRVKAHLLKIGGNGIKACPKATVGQILEMTKLEDEAMQRKERGQPKMVPLPRSFCSSSQSSSHSVSMDAINSSSFRQERYEPKKRKGVFLLNLARNPYYVRAFSFAANNNIAGYVPPGYNSLRTKLLQKEKANIENLLEYTESTWKTKGVTLVYDGWTDPQRRPLINFMAVNEGGTMFIRAVNCEGEYKDKWFVSTLIKEVMVEVGVANVVQIITDNAPVCKVAGLLVEQTYPHVFWTPCVVHTLNLALKNICATKNNEANGITYEECHWITEIVASALMIRNFFMNHSMRLAMFNEFSKLKLLVVAETRFASVIVMLKRFKLIKQQLKMMVISKQWSCYRDDNVTKAINVKEKLLDDSWWDLIDYILDFTEPIYEMVRATDTD